MHRHAKSHWLKPVGLPLLLHRSPYVSPCFLLHIHKNFYHFTLDQFLSSSLRLFPLLPVSVGDRGSTVVKVLCYKSEGRWFDSSWCHKILLIALWTWGRLSL